MTRKHPKSRKGEPHPDPNKNGSPKETSNRHVYVEPGAQIDLVEDLKKEYKTANKETSTNNDKQLFWTKVASGLLVITAFFTGWQLSIASNTFRATVRPYVGEEGVNYMYFFPSSDGTMEQSPIWIPEATSIQMKIPIKNFGPVPATNFKADWKVMFGGKEITIGGHPSRPATPPPCPDDNFQTWRTGAHHVCRIQRDEFNITNTTQNHS